MNHKLVIDKWIALEMSSRKIMKARRIEELLNTLNPSDVIIASALSRLGRSMKLSTLSKVLPEKSKRD